MRKDISKKLNEILLKRIGIDFQKHPELKKENLLGKNLKVPARELILVCFDIEKIFDVCIPEEEYIAGNVKNYQQLEHMIGKLLKLS